MLRRTFCTVLCVPILTVITMFMNTSDMPGATAPLPCIDNEAMICQVRLNLAAPCPAKHNSQHK